MTVVLKTYLAQPAPWSKDICPCGSSDTEMLRPRGQTRHGQYVDGLQFDLKQPLGPRHVGQNSDLAAGEEEQLKCALWRFSVKKQS